VKQESFATSSSSLTEVKSLAQAFQEIVSTSGTELQQPQNSLENAPSGEVVEQRFESRKEVSSSSSTSIVQDGTDAPPVVTSSGENTTIVSEENFTQVPKPGAAPEVQNLGIVEEPPVVEAPVQKEEPQQQKVVHEDVVQQQEKEQNVQQEEAQAPIAAAQLQENNKEIQQESIKNALKEIISEIDKVVGSSESEFSSSAGQQQQQQQPQPVEEVDNKENVGPQEIPNVNGGEQFYQVRGHLLNYNPPAGNL
jgi:hypothetical protein